jgi:hypothetical protein
MTRFFGPGSAGSSIRRWSADREEMNSPLTNANNQGKIPLLVGIYSLPQGEPTGLRFLKPDLSDFPASGQSSSLAPSSSYRPSGFRPVSPSFRHDSPPPGYPFLQPLSPLIQATAALSPRLTLTEPRFGLFEDASSETAPPVRLCRAAIPPSLREALPGRERSPPPSLPRSRASPSLSLSLSLCPEAELPAPPQFLPGSMASPSLCLSLFREAELPFPP